MTQSAPHAFWPKFATAASVVVAITLVAIKLVAWQMSGSVAVLGSLADSILDILASVIAFVGVRIALQPPDDDHRFGHEKAEAVSSLVQLVLITGAAVFVLVEAIEALINPVSIRVPNIAMMAMGLSLIITLALVAIQTLAVRKSGSLATESDRAHYISDILANAGALFAIVLASQFGWLRADGVAGLIAAAILFYAVVDIAKRALPQLLDEELGAEERERIIALVMEDEGVMGVHGIRTRRAGQRRHIQLHLELPGAMVLRDVHMISDRVEHRLESAYPGADILIHQDPHEYVDAVGEHERGPAPDERVVQNA